uniref:Reverse transcriptase domain-containing protein n=1 Tax=Vombatus ursinus TaxID=29139 RepID=A0A4X2KU20_VOMUR
MKTPENITVYSSIFCNGDKLKAFPIRLRVKQGCLLSQSLFLILLEMLARAIRQEQKSKGINTGMVYLENPRETTKKVIKTINNFSKVA